MQDIKQKVKEIKQRVEKAIDSFDLPEKKKEILKFEKKVDKFELKIFLSGLYDSKNVIISIHAGQGGVEAMDWTSMLYRMYLRYCERKGWSTETVDISEGEETGV